MELDCRNIFSDDGATTPDEPDFKAKAWVSLSLGFVYQTVWDIACVFQATERYVRGEVGSLSLTGE